jgi:hypothetical protein
VIPNCPAAFANQASIALEVSEARLERERAALLDDRDRIAADLHDRVVQRLFGAGLTLHGVRREAPTRRSSMASRTSSTPSTTPSPSCAAASSASAAGPDPTEESPSR